MSVRMFKPKNLFETYCLTNLREATLEVVKRKNKLAITSNGGSFEGRVSYGNNSKAPLLAFPAPNNGWKPKPNTHVNSLVEEGDEELTMQDEIPQISLNALNGFNTFQTMRVTGKVGKHELHILVDFGSTHNFLDVNVPKHVGCLEDVKWFWRFNGWQLLVISNDAMLLLRLVPSGKVFGYGDQCRLLMYLCLFYPNTGVQLMNDEGQREKEPLDPELNKVMEAFEDVHLPMQKDAIEVIVKELLDSGVIKPSKSPFASPIVMVKKKDNTWRMSEYHQIMMYKDDIAKTAFKAHQGHYEYLVIPFGLTSAPSTFQALMNVNKLFVKKSKCVFGTSHFKYLGKVISAKGVAIDPSKISAMQEYPTPTNVNQLRGFLGLTG
ncbi:hypothetical protein Tco_0879531 [Tanacetum coccineum]